VIDKTARRRNFPIEANEVSSWVDCPGARQIRVGEIDAAEAAGIVKKSMDLEVGALSPSLFVSEVLRHVSNVLWKTPPQNQI
jgi:hypothetical protein